jgi:hypothetical protein
MKVCGKLALVLAIVTFSGINSSYGDHASRKSLADKHAPAGIMGDHMHEKGEWMLEYRYMNMYMEDNRAGTRRISDQAALGPIGGTPGAEFDGVTTNAGATPTQMTMEMHMMHVMYGVSDNVTLYTMLMLPSLTMDHLRGDMNPAGRNTPFTTHNSGFGDTTVGALMRLYSDDDQDFVLNLAGSLPTGDIYRESSAPTAGAISQALPYPMRLGSGTFNARPGMTYKRFMKWGSWGTQLATDLPIGRNYRGYSVSDEFRLNTWTSVLLTEKWSASFRVENRWRTDFDGEDAATPNGVVSTNVEQFRGGYWLNLGLGTQAIWNGHDFNVEIVPTVYQDLNGVQLETDYSVIASWSKAW